TVEGRAMLAKRCRLGTEELAALLVNARRHVPFVQANLIGVVEDDPALVDHWRKHLIDRGVWANEPVPLYPYPSSPSYREIWGEPDDLAWERAHEHYLASFRTFSDIQEKRPRALAELEATCCSH
ncbi:MAG: B12-binding domain-containing radical SAM protein, partial [Mesorhizobium sp.]